MTYRTLCKCECHTSIIPILHIQACCYPDPSIEEAWDNFRQKMVHPKASDQLLRTMRVAFYSAMAQLIQYIEDMGKVGDEQFMIHVIEGMRDEAVKYFDNLRKEL
jgi:hypothetical protein